MDGNAYPAESDRMTGELVVDEDGAPTDIDGRVIKTGDEVANVDGGTAMRTGVVTMIGAGPEWGGYVRVCDDVTGRQANYPDSTLRVHATREAARKLYDEALRQVQPRETTKHERMLARLAGTVGARGLPPALD